MESGAGADGNGRVVVRYSGMRLCAGDGGSGIGIEDAGADGGIAGEIQKRWGLEDAGGLRSRMDFSIVLRSNAPTATLLVRDD